MAFVTRKITRTSQPQELVGIDWSNPVTDGLAEYYPLTDPRGIIRNVTGKPTNGATFSGSDIGVSATFDGVNDYIAIPSTPLALGNQLTVMFAMKMTANPETSRQFVFGSDDATKAIQVEVGNCNTMFPGTVAIQVNGTFIASSSLHSINQNVWQVWAITKNGTFAGATTFYKGGIQLGSSYNVTFALQDVVSTRRIGQRSGAQPIPFSGQLSNLGFWNRVLQDEEIKSLSDNPWQIFEPIEETICIPDGVSVTLPTLVQPASTTSAGTWTPVGAATLHEAIDEVTPSDADYISVAAASTCELLLVESAFPTGNVSLSYRALSSTGSTLTVTLKQGTTTIMMRTHALTGTAALYTQALTAGEVAAIVAGPIACTLTSS